MIPPSIVSWLRADRDAYTSSADHGREEIDALVVPAKPVEISSTINDLILTCSRMLFIFNKRDNNLNQRWHERVH
eukprot:scaffold1610_cov39-Cyclotella_meneghiniana.AAC.4